MNEISSKSPTNPVTSNAGLSGINIMLGIWLIISTIAIAGINHSPAARRNNFIIGVLVAIFGFVRAAEEHTLWSWFNMILGAWLIISPFALGFTMEKVALLHNVIVGILVGVLAWNGSFHPATSAGRDHL